MKTLLALGGNALLKRGEPLDVDVQRRNIRAACAAIAPIASEHNVVLTHGNGPQVGLLALQAAAYKVTAPYPLDVLGAESEGMIGYLLEQEMINAQPGCPVSNLLTQTLVHIDDPAFENPTKFIGPVYTAQQAQLHASKKGWTVKPDGKHYRRVVPSPAPQEIIDLPAIRVLSEAGFMVICTGGGGIPVVRNSKGMLQGVEAVVDKDLASAKLAIELQVDNLLLLTDVDAVYQDWGTEKQSPIRESTTTALGQHEFAAGSMGPKVKAACLFAQESGKQAYIGSLEQIQETLLGKQVTAIRRG